MKIKTIISEYRNDFTADYECEHCGAVKARAYGYHDNYFHTVVIPGWACEKCGLRRDGKAVDTVVGGLHTVRPDPTPEEESHEVQHD